MVAIADIQAHCWKAWEQYPQAIRDELEREWDRLLAAPLEEGMALFADLFVRATILTAERAIAQAAAPAPIDVGFSAA